MDVLSEFDVVVGTGVVMPRWNSQKVIDEYYPLPIQSGRAERLLKL